MVLLSLLHSAAVLKTSRGSDASSLTMMTARSIQASGEGRSKSQELSRGLSLILWHPRTVSLARRTTNGLTIVGA